MEQDRWDYSEEDIYYKHMLTSNDWSFAKAGNEHAFNLTH